jgi:hypothetical protein
MIRLLARARAIMLTFAVAILIARLVGSTRPKPELFSVLFTNPDGSLCEKPCLFGIYPGKTATDKAIAILKQHPATSRMKQTEDTNFYAFSGGALHIQVNTQGAIDFTCTDDHLCIDGGSLGDLIVAFAKPAGFHTKRSYDHAWSIIFYEPGILFTFVGESTDYITPNDPLRNIAIDSLDGWMERYYFGLRGFGRVDRYLRQP